MLDAYIIDAIRQEELAREREFEKRRIHLELPIQMPTREPARDEKQEEERGPIVIPFGPDGVNDAA